MSQKKLVLLKEENEEISSHDFFVLAEKLDLMTIEEIEREIKDMGPDLQRNLVKQIFTFITKTGYFDVHKGNFSFIKSGPHAGKLAIFDTEPSGWIGHSLEESYNRPEANSLGIIRDYFEIPSALYGINDMDNEEKIGVLFDSQILEQEQKLFDSSLRREQVINDIKRKVFTVLPFCTLIVALGIRKIIDNI